MKNIKYMLFSLILCFLVIGHVNASCLFGSKESYLECSVNNGNINCTLNGAAKNTLEFSTGPKLFDRDSNLENVINTCADNSSIYIKTTKPNINSTKTTIIGIYSSESAGNVSSSEQIVSFPRMAKNDENNVNKDLSSYNGNACIYTSGVFKYTCTIKSGKPECILGCAKGSYCGDTYDISTRYSQSLTAGDFIQNNKFICPKNESNNLVICITKEGGKDRVTAVSKDCSGLPVTYSPKATTDDGTPGYNEDKPKNDNDERNGSIDGGRPETSKKDDDNKMQTVDLDSFCEGRMQGIFTTLGWVFFTLKILVPIILIIFGVIDLSKSVIASKDDEIKKAIKKLTMRAIAGIIIFLVPSVLDFVVNLIDGNDIYNEQTGSFAKCTSCIFKPNQTGCKNLRGN